jgi:hypothetical protein
VTTPYSNGAIQSLEGISSLLVIRSAETFSLQVFTVQQLPSVVMTVTHSKITPYVKTPAN